MRISVEVRDLAQGLKGASDTGEEFPVAHSLLLPTYNLNTQQFTHLKMFLSENKSSDTFHHQIMKSII